MTRLAGGLSKYAVAGAIALAAVGGTASCATARDRGGDPSRTIQVGSVSRSYRVHVPDRAPPPGGYPVMLAFHGGGGNGAKMADIMKVNPTADTQGFIVVYPDGLGRHWNDGRASIDNDNDDVGFVARLLDQIARDHPVNTDRVFAVGVSNGATFAQRLGCELSGRIRAIASVAGTMSADLAPACRPERPVSALQISGTADPIMPYGGGRVRQFLGAGQGGQVLSARDTVDLWARNARCAPPAPPQSLPPRTRPDGTSITRLSFDRCEGSTAVTLLTVENGGHAWPGGRAVMRRLFGRTSAQLDATQAVVDFFLRQPPRRN